MGRYEYVKISPMKLSCLFAMYMFLAYTQPSLIQASWSQNKQPVLDSLYQQIKEASISNLDLALTYAQEAHRLAIELNRPIDQGLSLKEQGRIYIQKQNFNEAMSVLQESVHVLQSLPDSTAQTYYWDSMRSLGVLYWNLGDYKKAIQYYLETQNYYRTNKRYADVAGTFNNIGILYHQAGEEEYAITHYKEALALLDSAQIAIPELHMQLQVNLGLSYFQSADYQAALDHYQVALDTTGFTIPHFAEGVIYGNLGLVYAKLKQFDRASSVFQKSIAIAEELGSPLSVAIVKGDYGEMFLERGRGTSDPRQTRDYFNRALILLEQATAVFKTYQNQEHYQKALLSLSELYQEQGDYEKALILFKKQEALKDSLTSVHRDENLRVAELENKFEQQTLTLRHQTEQEIAVREVKIQMFKTVQLYFIVGITVLLLLGGMLFWQNNRRKHINKQLKQVNAELKTANQIKARLFAILNHDLRRPVSNLISFITLQQKQSNQLTEAVKTRLENKLLEEAENLLQNMEDLLLWSKDQMQNFKPHFQEFSVRELFEEMTLFFEKFYQVKIDYEAPNDFKIYSDTNYLKTIMRNLTANAVAAGKDNPNHRIIWKAYNQNRYKILSISDNGQDVDEEVFRPLYDNISIKNIDTGLGLHLVRDLAKTIGCTIKTTTQGEGTTITLNFQAYNN